MRRLRFRFDGNFPRHQIPKDEQNSSILNVQRVAKDWHSRCLDRFLSFTTVDAEDDDNRNDDEDRDGDEDRNDCGSQRHLR